MKLNIGKMSLKLRLIRTMNDNLQTPSEPNQIRALEIFVDSATFDNGYKPMSLERIAIQIKSEGLNASSSSIGRWKKLFYFDKHLELKIDTVMAHDENNDIKAKAFTKATADTIDRFKANGELINDLYVISQCFTDKVKEDIAQNRFNREDIKLAKDFLLLTTGREDKMLDRLADTGRGKLSSAEMKEQFEMIDVEIEDE